MAHLLKQMYVDEIDFDALMEMVYCKISTIGSLD